MSKIYNVMSDCDGIQVDATCATRELAIRELTRLMLEDLSEESEEQEEEVAALLRAGNIDDAVYAFHRIMNMSRYIVESECVCE